jgi:hypothetical protein
MLGLISELEHTMLSTPLLLGAQLEQRAETD